jgi:hypothetical protein
VGLFNDDLRNLASQLMQGQDEETSEELSMAVADDALQSIERACAKGGMIDVDLFLTICQVKKLNVVCCVLL